MAGLIRGVVRKKRKFYGRKNRGSGGDYDYQLFAASHTVKSCEDGRKLGARYNRVRAERAVVIPVDYAVCHCPADSIAVTRGISAESENTPRSPLAAGEPAYLCRIVTS